MTLLQANRLLLPVFLLLCVPVHANTSNVCNLASKRGGLIKYSVSIDPDKQGSKVLIADFDDDGSKDHLKWLDPGAGSIIPADNAIATLTLTSHKSFTLEQQHLHVVKLNRNYYVVTGWLETEQGPWHRDVFTVTRTGFDKICSFSGPGLGH